MRATPPRFEREQKEDLDADALNNLTPGSGDMEDEEAVSEMEMSDMDADKRSVNQRVGREVPQSGHTVLEPLAAWLVGPSASSRLANADQSGCLALNQFSNGFMIGIHGSVGIIEGLSIDTRQGAFKAGSPYTVSIFTGGDSKAVVAIAKDEGSLSINLNDAPDFLSRVGSVGFFGFRIGETRVHFSTVGMTDGLARLRECLEERVELATAKEADDAPRDILDNDPNAEAGVIGANAEQALLENAMADRSVRAARGADANVRPMAVTKPGKNIPIAMAVTDLIPGGHRFVIERGINPMARITWEKGPFWLDVLRGAVAEHGLYVHVNDRLIKISRDAALEKTPAQKSSAYSTSVDGDDENPDMADRVVKADGGVVGKGHDVNADDFDQSAAHGMTSEYAFDAEKTWVADRGEMLSEILEHWSSFAGVRLVLDLSDDLPLEQDFTFTGTFEEAVTLLLDGVEMGYRSPVGVFSHSVKPDLARVQRSSSNAATIRPRTSIQNAKPIGQTDRDLIALQRRSEMQLGHLKSKNFYGRPDTDAVSVDVWRALEGQSLEDVLREWSQRAGVELYWMMDQQFALPESFKIQGSFSDAVSGVLRSFATDNIKPTAQINNDPVTGESALIMRVHGMKSQ